MVFTCIKTFVRQISIQLRYCIIRRFMFVYTGLIFMVPRFLAVSFVFLTVPLLETLSEKSILLNMEAVKVRALKSLFSIVQVKKLSPTKSQS